MLAPNDLEGLQASEPSCSEHVILVDEHGRPNGLVPKSEAHHADTALHVAFSCYVVGPDGRTLLTRRSGDKVTWPGTWTNGCCGHPQLGETLREAVERRLYDELHVVAADMEVAIADFAYRAAMDDGPVEHELCPVLVVEIAGSPDPDPAEVDAWCWVQWDDLVRRAVEHPDALSPWCVEQVTQLAELGVEPSTWLHGRTRRAALLDRRIGHLRGLSEPTVVGVCEGRAPVVDDRLPHPTRSSVDEKLDSFLHAKVADLAELDPSVAALGREVKALVDAGGKRLRPAFTYWGHRATGARHDDEIVAPAAAMELLHTFALIHDDIMDRSARRRGRPAAFVAMADEHRDTGGTGDSEWFGVSAAILAGDLAFVWADEMIDTAAVGEQALARARQVFTTLRSEVIAGQHLDLVIASTNGAREADARKVALLKSARYTVTRPLLLGAALADGGPDADCARALVDYGDAVGLAFQMRDDLLGVFGDPELTGKSRLDDLREGKQTVLVLRAHRLAGPAGRAELERCLGQPDLDEAGAARCRDVIASSGALASVEALLADRHEAALHAIEQLPDEPRRALTALAASAIDRLR